MQKGILEKDKKTKLNMSKTSRDITKNKFKATEACIQKAIMNTIKQQNPKVGGFQML